MSQFWSEYGLIGLLIAVALGGYFLLGEEREDILASSLDALGLRLTELVEDTEAKAKTADNFQAFKEAVAANQIPPEEVERVAASVLNLSTSGKKLTPEEAEMVFNVAIEGDYGVLPSPAEELPDTPVANRPPPPPKSVPDIVKAWEAKSSAQVGERVAIMVEFADRMKEVAAQQEEGGPSVHFVVQDGLRVLVDSSLTPVLKQRYAPEMTQNLERDSAVIWEKNLSEQRRKVREVYVAQREKISAAEKAGGAFAPNEAEQLKALEQIARLHEMGVIFQADSSFIRLRMERIMEDALKHVKRELDSLNRADSIRAGAASG